VTKHFFGLRDGVTDPQHLLGTRHIQDAPQRRRHARQHQLNIAQRCLSGSPEKDV
jgi:hypothetical protein